MFQIKASRHLKIRGQLPAPPSKHPHLRMNYKICEVMETYLNSLAPSWSFNDPRFFRIIDGDEGFFRSLDWLRAHAENCRILTVSLHWEGDGPFWFCITTYHGQVLIIDLNILPRLPDEVIPSELSTVLKDFLLVGEDMQQMLIELGLVDQPYLDRDAIDMLNFEHPNFPYSLDEEETGDRGFLTALMYDFYPGALGDVEERDRPLGLSNAVSWGMLYPLGEELTTLKRAYLRMTGLAGFYSIGLFSLLVFSGGQLLTPREAVVSMLLNHCTTRLVKMVYSKRTVRSIKPSPSVFSVTYETGEICTVQKSSSCYSRSEAMSGDSDDVLDLGPGSPFGDVSEAGPKSEPEVAEEEAKSEDGGEEEGGKEDTLPGLVNETPPREETDSEDDSSSSSDSDSSEDSTVEGFEVAPVEDPSEEDSLDAADRAEIERSTAVLQATVASASIVVPPEEPSGDQEFSAEGAVGGEVGEGEADAPEDEVRSEEGAGRGRGRRQEGERRYSWSAMRATGTVPIHLWEAGQIGNQYRGIGRPDPYEAPRTRPEGAYGPARRPRISVPRPEDFAEYPVRYRAPASWGRACSFCGATNHVSARCGLRLSMIRKHGASSVGWPVTCLYPYCFNKRGHKSAACPALHAYCGRCKRRGHLPGTCDSMPAVGEDVIAENYVLYCNYGRYTRNYFNRFELEWSFLGPSVDKEDLREVGVGSHRAMVGWTDAQMEEFNAADEATKHSMITKEIFR